MHHPSAYAPGMARYFDVHPVDPQRRAIGQVVDLLRDGGLIVYPTDSAYALGCQLGEREGIDRIRTIRKLDDRHPQSGGLARDDALEVLQLELVDLTVYRHPRVLGIDHPWVDVADRIQPVARRRPCLGDEASTVEVLVQDVTTHERAVDKQFDFQHAPFC